MTDIKIRKLAGNWSIRAAGAVIGETHAALELVEGKYAPVIYIPRADIAMAILEKSEKTTHCPHKGTASYYSVHTKNGPIQDIAWSYEDPLEGVSEIAGHLSFYPHEKLAIENV